MSSYDYHGICPLCGDHVDWINGKTNTGVVLIKTKRKSTNLYHEVCIDQERKQNKRGQKWELLKD